jgi:tRNA U34 5-methylaminomethyl-2-thiouridine-forming methyltransferase MnmC
MAVELYQTKDQSYTLYVPELDETYHSRNGAVEEAMYVYIGRGLQDFVAGRKSTVHGPQTTVEETYDENAIVVREKSTVRSPWSAVSKSTGINADDEREDLPIAPIHERQRTADNSLAVLEVGFGTGLNAWLTVIECEKRKLNCVYHSLEIFPLKPELVARLNYTEQAPDADQKLFPALHTCNWNEAAVISDFFVLTKLEVPLQSFEASRKYDIIYFDAFAPDKQPELWTREVFQRLYDCMNPNGVIVTYSSKGEIKRTWKEIGLEVERLPGPPMKRHMLRGRKNV